MPKPVAVVASDLHFGVYKSADYFANIQRTWATWVRDQMVALGCTKLILGGDTFEDNNSVHLKTMSLAKDIFDDTWGNFEVEVLAGNHDVHGKGSNDVHSTVMLDDGMRVKVYNEPTVIDVGNLKVLMLPWDGKLSDDKVRAYASTGIDVCVCHAAVRGFEVRKGVPCDGAVTVDPFMTSFKRTLSGHFHMPSDRGTFSYIGSPYQITMNDIGDNKRLLVLMDDCSVVEIINNISPKFVVVKASEAIMNLPSLMGNHVRVINDLDRESYQKVHDVMSKTAVTIADKKDTVSVGQMAISLDIDTSSKRRAAEIIADYVKSAKIPSTIDPVVLIDKYIRPLSKASTKYEPGRINMEEISITNFLSVGSEEVKVSYGNSGITMIFGKNLDSEQVRSNGSGKTAIFVDAPIFLLTGSAMKEVAKKESLSHDGNQGTTVVQGVFSKNGVRYKIRRTLSPNSVELSTEVGGKWVAFEMGVAQTNAEITNIVGWSKEVLQSLIIINIKRMKAFTNSSSDTKRGMWEAVLRLDEYTAMKDAIKVLMNDRDNGVINRLAALKTKLDGVRKYIANQKTTINDLVVASTKAVQPLIDSLEHKHKELELLEMSFDQSAYEALVIKRMNNTKLIEKATAQLHHFRNLATNADVEIKSANNLLQAGKNDMAKFLANTSSAICGHCLSPVDKSHVDSVKAGFESKIADLEVNVTVVVKKKDAPAKAISIIETQIAAINADERALSAGQDEMATIKRSIDAVKRDIATTEANIEQMKRNNNYTGIIKKTTEALDKMVADEFAMTNEQAELNTDKMYYEVCNDILSDTGVRNYIIGKTLPAVQDMINRYLHHMGAATTTGGISAKFESMGDIQVTKVGKPTFEINNMSEGERLTFDWAVMLAFIQLSIASGTVQTNFIVLDEALDTSVDSVGLSNFIKIMREILDQNSINAFITSHNENVFANSELGFVRRAVVTKHKNASTLEQY
jgi:DNA repair exonuclease SbcCD ATPase subunit